jgi:hypothetical protein
MSQNVGDLNVVVTRAVWAECVECDAPATCRVTYLLNGARHNPASRAYGRDDCTWLEDYHNFACGEHERAVEHNPPNGYGYCSTFQLSAFPHMGLVWVPDRVAETAAKVFLAQRLLATESQ